MNDNPFVKLDLVEGSEELYVVFASRGRKTFEMVGTLSGIKVSKLFLREQHGAAWYQQGVPDFAPTIHALSDAIRTIVVRHGFKLVTCIGASMGGYAALGVGAMLNADRVVAFSPQVMLNPGWALSPHESVQIELQTVQELVAKATSTQFILLASSETLDVYHASLIASHRHVNVNIVRSAHNTLSALRDCGALRDFLPTILSGNGVSSIETVQFDPVFGSDHLALALSAYFQKEYATALTAFKRVCLLRNDWSDAYFMVGKCYQGMGLYDEALPFFVKTYNLDNLNHFIFPCLICATAVTGNLNRAMDLVTEYTTLLKISGRSLPEALNALARLAFLQKQYSLSVYLREQLRNKFKSNTVENLYQLARSQVPCGLLSEAKQNYKTVLDRQTELGAASAWIADMARQRLEKMVSAPTQNG